jgi:hypothetical protein
MVLQGRRAVPWCSKAGIILLVLSVLRSRVCLVSIASSYTRLVLGERPPLPPSPLPLVPVPRYAWACLRYRRPLAVLSHGAPSPLPLVLVVSCAVSPGLRSSVFLELVGVEGRRRALSCLCVVVRAFAFAFAMMATRARRVAKRVSAAEDDNEGRNRRAWQQGCGRRGRQRERVRREQ